MALIWSVAACKEPAPEVKLARNVIVIVADDLPTFDVSAYPKARIKTPHLEALAKAGVRFDQAYSASSVSGPARAGLLTGRYPSRYGYEYDNGPGSRDQAEGLGLPETEMTLASTLRESGFKTAAFGRWHLGNTAPFYPSVRGFDVFAGVLSGTTPYGLPDAPDIVFSPTLAFPAPPMRGVDNAFVKGPENRPLQNTGRYLTYDITDKALQFINENKDKRFFLYVPYTAPHPPLQAPKELYDALGVVKDERERTYVSMVRALDNGVGEIMAALKAAKLDKDTLVIFTSDNGCNLEGETCPCDRLRGGAITMYEGGLRVPLIMTWPGGIPPGAAFPDMVSTLDIFRTVVAATNAKRPPGVRLDSVNLLPYLASDKKDPPHDRMIWFRRPLVAFRLENWKLIDDPDQGTMELYDLSADPREQTNLVNSRPDVMTRIRTEVTLTRSLAIGPRWQPAEKVILNQCGDSYSQYR
jgi:arylsulfatase A-like enzyme